MYSKYWNAVDTIPSCSYIFSEYCRILQYWDTSSGFKRCYTLFALWYESKGTVALLQWKYLEFVCSYKTFLLSLLCAHFLSTVKIQRQSLSCRRARCLCSVQMPTFDVAVGRLTALTWYLDCRLELSRLFLAAFSISFLCHMEKSRSVWQNSWGNRDLWSEFQCLALCPLAGVGCSGCWSALNWEIALPLRLPTGESHQSSVHQSLPFVSVTPGDRRDPGSSPVV